MRISEWHIKEGDKGREIPTQSELQKLPQPNLGEDAYQFPW